MVIISQAGEGGDGMFDKTSMYSTWLASKASPAGVEGRRGQRLGRRVGEHV